MNKGESIVIPFVFNIKFMIKYVFNFFYHSLQAEQLTRNDVLVEHLYTENACLTANLKRLQQHYKMLTGLHAELTPI